MPSSYQKIRTAHKRRQKAENDFTQYFRFDSKVWKLVVKELSPESAYWLSEDLKPKDRLLFKDCLVKVNKKIF